MGKNIDISDLLLTGPEEKVTRHSFGAKSWLKAAAALAANGFTRPEIADKLELSDTELDIAYKSPDFPKLVSTELASRGISVSTFLRSQVVDAILLISNMMSDPRVKDQTRLAAARDLLDRTVGRVTTPIEPADTSSDLASRAAAIDAEIETLESQERLA
jgi:hypothetical protein